MPADPLRQKQLFDQALARPLEERAAFLDDACGADGDLRVRVDALLASLAAASDFLADPAPAAGGSNEKPGGVIDRYRLLQRIGEGGFGT
ncbi:MAG TPA: hypothetical protein VFZ65_22130, partial [Planctomycetota bacterium]|nr:hypothetical protein [Planctomycetota bacterium]